MSYRKWGRCKICDTPFNVSIGHPENWNTWAFCEDDMTPLQKWWWDNIELCTECESPFDEGKTSWMYKFVAEVKER